ncbi:hypothetical protein D3C73_789800 [compost metagenome]
MYITVGRETNNSYPSLLIFSISIERCNSPLPETLKLSGDSVSSTLKDTLVSTSLNNLSLKCLEVINLPSLPARGPLFTLNVIVTVGSSISTKSTASGFAGSAIVSPILIPSNPVTATISPHEALSVSTLFKPIYVNNLPTFKFAIVPSFLQRATC